jgi:hypothetical protein
VSSPRFKKGDKVVVTANNEAVYGREGEVISYWFSSKKYHVRCPYDHTCTITTGAYEHELELPAIFNSPLYKALS